MSQTRSINVRSLRSDFVTFLLIWLFLALGFFWLTTLNGKSVVYAQSIPQIDRAVVPSPFVQEFNVPIRNFAPTGLTVDSSNNVWFAGSNRSAIFTFFPKNESFKEYPFNAPKVAKEGISSVAVSQLVYDEVRKRVWFTWADSNSIGELNTETAQVRLHSIPTKDSGPFGILIGSDDALWFTELFGEKIGRLDPSTGKIVEYLVPSSSSGPIGPALLAADSEGRIWFTEAYGKRIGLIDPKAVGEDTSNGIREFDPPYMVNSPIGIGVSKGVVWFTDHASSSFNMFVPANNTWKQFWVSQPPPEANFPDSLPNQLLIDDRGNIWMVEHVGNRIAKFDSSRGSLTEYEVPSRPLALTLWLASDRDGNVWFTEWATNKIGIVNVTTPIPFNLGVSSNTVVITGKESEAVINFSITSSTNDPITLAVGGLSEKGPGIITSEFSPYTRITRSGTTEGSLKISELSNLKLGTYMLLVSAKDGKVIQSATVTLSMTASSALPQQISLFVIFAAPIVTGIIAVYYVRRRASNPTKDPARLMKKRSIDTGPSYVAHPPRPL